MRLLMVLRTLLAVVPAWAQDRIPATVAESIARPFEYVQQEFLAVAEAMPEQRYGFTPTAGEFKTVRRVDGPYAGPNLGIAEVAVWHISDHYGQIVEYLRMNGNVPPSTKQYGLAVR